MAASKHVIPLSFTGRTSGHGFWSAARAEVPSERSVLFTYDWSDNFGELRVHFSPKDWDVNDDGLIYTDPTWLKDLRDSLISSGFSAEAAGDVDYSEQGMQGDDYVSLDVGGKFIREALHRAGGANPANPG